MSSDRGPRTSVATAGACFIKSGGFESRIKKRKARIRP